MLFLKEYKKAFEILKKKPLLLWGLSLLNVLLTVIALVITTPLTIIGVAASYLLSCGMVKVYLDFLKGKEVNSDQLFAAFNKNAMRIIGGMAWCSLWIFIWALVPIAGPVLAIIKSYEYKYVPYILMTKPEVTATQALRLSMQMTKGKRVQLFLADLCLFGTIFVASLVITLVFTALSSLSMKLLFSAGSYQAAIYVGGFFSLIGTLITGAINLLTGAFAPIFTGLYGASFYLDEETEQAPATV